MSADEERASLRGVSFDGDDRSSTVATGTTAAATTFVAVPQKKKRKAKPKKSTASEKDTIKPSDQEVPGDNVSPDPGRDNTRDSEPEAESTEPERRASSPVHLHVIEARITSGGVLKYLTGDGALQRPAYVRQMREMYGLDTSKLDNLRPTGTEENSKGDGPSDNLKRQPEESGTAAVMTTNDVTSPTQGPTTDISMTNQVEGTDTATATAATPIALLSDSETAVLSSQIGQNGNPYTSSSRSSKRLAPEDSLVPPVKRLKATPASLSIDLDSLNLSLLPQHLIKPLETLVKKFRGPLEDVALRTLIEVELAWYPVSYTLFMLV